MFDFTKILKYNDSGLVDVQKTTEAFGEALNQYAALQKSDLETIQASVAAVWDENPAQSVMALDSLATLAAFKCGATAGDLAAVKERCADYIRTAKGLYKIAKGRNGGVSRVKPETTPQS